MAVSPVDPAAKASQLLARAALLLRVPTCPNRPPEPLVDGTGLRCPATGRVYPYRDGVLDLLPDSPSLTLTQRVLTAPFAAAAYDRCRGALVALLGAPDFTRELAAIRARLMPGPGDTVFDLACGHGNFTVAWAEAVGPTGLVLGLDISWAMLSRAAQRLRRAGAGNSLLVRGDAHALPLADACLDRVNCSGGFHQLPNLPRALQEIARVSNPGARLTALTLARAPGDRWDRFKHWCGGHLALHFVPLERLGVQLAALGYENYRWELPGGWFGYGWASKASAPNRRHQAV
jgi:ubiquinone/menaquinone biosynthesis C-methylase UbiE